MDHYESVSHEFVFVESENVNQVNICPHNKPEWQKAYGKLERQFLKWCVLLFGFTCRKLIYKE